MATGSLKDLASRVRSNPDLVEDAEIVREVKRPMEKTASAAKEKLSRKSVFGTIKDLVKESKGYASAGWKREKSVTPEASKTFKDDIRDAVRDARQQMNRKSIMDNLGSKLSKAKTSVQGKVVDALKNPISTLKSVGKMAVENATGGIFTRKDSDDGETPVSPGASEETKLLGKINDKLGTIKGLLGNEVKQMHLLGSKVERLPGALRLAAPKPVMLPAPRNLPQLPAPRDKYAVRRGSGLKRNDAGFNKLIALPGPKESNRGNIIDMAKDAQGTAANSSSGGLMDAVLDKAGDFLGDRMRRRLPGPRNAPKPGGGLLRGAGRMGLQALRGAGPVALAAAPLAAMYGVSKWAESASITDEKGEMTGTGSFLDKASKMVGGDGLKPDSKKTADEKVDENFKDRWWEFKSSKDEKLKKQYQGYADRGVEISKHERDKLQERFGKQDWINNLQVKGAKFDEVLDGKPKEIEKVAKAMEKNTNEQIKSTAGITQALDANTDATQKTVEPLTKISSDDWLKNMGDGLKNSAGQAASWIGERLKGGAQSVKDWGQKVQESTAGKGGWTEKLGNLAGKATDKIGSGLESVGMKAGDVGYNLQKGSKSQLELANAFQGGSTIKGLNAEQTKAYAGNTAFTESGGKVGITNQYGFAGQYQFGAEALAENGFMDKKKLEAARAKAKAEGKSWYKDGLHKQFMEDGSNWTNEGGREAFLKDKKMQDDLFVKYTNKNIEGGFASKALTKDSSPEQIAAYAKAAHLKGVGGANDYFLKGKDSADANGTSVSKYANGAAESMTKLSKQVTPVGDQPKTEVAKTAEPTKVAAAEPVKKEKAKASRVKAEPEIAALTGKQEKSLFAKDQGLYDQFKNHEADLIDAEYDKVKAGKNYASMSDEDRMAAFDAANKKARLQATKKYQKQLAASGVLEKDAGAASTQLAKVPEPSFSADVVEQKTGEAAAASNQPIVIPVPQPAPSGGDTSSALASSSTNKGGVPMASRNTDTSIQRLTAGQMSYGNA